ncbi:MAG TPA: class I SAM-dependent methyltransferase [Bacteroidota bacterium]|nr:class I SAM-dependent methyltransferase [Bacteroidota bacterium]
MVEFKDEYRILDVGCGLRKKEGAIGIDINPRSDADVVHDLNVTPYPFVSNYFDEILCDNVLEHLDNIVKVMSELHRLAKPSGKVTIVVPFFPHRQANTDPTHLHFFGIHSFDYFTSGNSYADFRYAATQFELLTTDFDRGVRAEHWFDRAIKRFANDHKDLYENRFANIFPLRSITFVLKAIK